MNFRYLDHVPKSKFLLHMSALYGWLEVFQHFHNIFPTIVEQRINQIEKFILADDKKDFNPEKNFNTDKEGRSFHICHLAAKGGHVSIIQWLEDLPKNLFSMKQLDRKECDQVSVLYRVFQNS